MFAFYVLFTQMFYFFTQKSCSCYCLRIVHCNSTNWKIIYKSVGSNRGLDVGVFKEYALNSKQKPQCFHKIKKNDVSLHGQKERLVRTAGYHITSFLLSFFSGENTNLKDYANKFTMEPPFFQYSQHGAWYRVKYV